MFVLKIQTVKIFIFDEILNFLREVTNFPFVSFLRIYSLINILLSVQMLRSFTIFRRLFCNYTTKLVVGADYNCLTEAIPMRTHSCKYSKTPLTWNTDGSFIDSNSF